MIDDDAFTDAVQVKRQFDVLPECLGPGAGLVRHHPNGPARKNDLIIAPSQSAPIQIVSDRANHAVIHAI